MKTTYQIRVDDNLHDAYQMVCDENSLSMSEVTRRHMREVVEEGRDALSEDQLRQVEIEKIKREGKEQSSDARKRINVTERVKEMFKQPYSADEIAKDIESYIRVDELEGRDERARYIRGLVEMAHLFRDYDEWDERQELPPSVFAAIDAYGKKYPEEHIEYLEELAEKADMETNGYIESEEMSEEESQAIKDAFTPEYENEGGAHNLICDGGVDVREARDAAEDDAQAGVETFDVDGEAVEYATRRERIRDELDGELVGLTVSHRTSGAVYMIATRRVDWGDVDAEDAARDNWRGVDKRMIIWDTDDEDVVVTDRGYWTPEDADTMRAEARQASRASSEIDGKVDAEEPLVVDATDEDKLDVDAFLSRSVEVRDEGDRYDGQATNRMESDPGISPKRDWGYNAGPPPEVEIVAERLKEAGEKPEDHLFRLDWGQKSPYADERKGIEADDELRPVDELVGNYGIEMRKRNEGLIAIDRDYPEKFPDDIDEKLPETFSISSPHGDDERKHQIFYCYDKEEIKERIGGWAAAPDWGDLQIGNPFIVGAGCQLSTAGCNKGEYNLPHDDGCKNPECTTWMGCEKCRGGCGECSDPEGGYYEILDNVPVMAIDPDTVVELYERGTSDDGQETLDSEDDEDETGGGYTTECCGTTYYDEDKINAVPMDGDVMITCSGGCPE